MNTGGTILRDNGNRGKSHHFAIIERQMPYQSALEFLVL